MKNVKTTIRRMGVLAAAATAAVAGATLAPPETTIRIDRQLDKPVLSVAYQNAAASLVEFRLNGESIATRAITGGKTAGETNFTFDPADLKDGENTVEIRLFDRTGKLVGRETTIIRADQSAGGPVFMVAPKMGQTVMGAVELKMGSTEAMRDAYVSFFVNGEFRSMLNVPPFVWTWDTARETNGWHDVEAWAVDDSNVTLKTKKVRVFVNNPGGRTDRQGVVGIQELVPVANPGRAVSGTDRGLKTSPVTPGRAVSRRGASLPPALSPSPVVGNPATRVAIAGEAGLKSSRYDAAVAMGARDLVPTGRRAIVKSVVVKPVVVKKAPVVKVVAVRPVKTTRVAPLPVAVAAVVKTAPVVKPSFAPRLSLITGTRVPDLGTFAIAYRGEYVNFDVAPRVVDGIPMSPFRHLIERAGGKVDWRSAEKAVDANAEGRSIFLKIGDRLARINGSAFQLEIAPFLERGRTVVPVSFFRSALSVEVEYDRATGHVLILPKK